MKCWRNSWAYLFAGALSVLHSQPAAPAPEGLPKDLGEAVSKAIEVEKKPSGSLKLDAPLEAVAQGWRRLGTRGAEQEVDHRGLLMDHWRLPCVIQLKDASGAGRVESAIKRNWGEILVIQEDHLYAWVPVHALRRVSQMPEVQRIEMDRRVVPLWEHPRK